jgi:hypothetical protein
VKVHELVSRGLFDAGAAGLTSQLAEARGWTINAATFPLVDITFAAQGRASIRARFFWQDWDSQPPSVEWLSVGGEPLKALPVSPRGQLNSSPHPTTGKPFVCMIGVREYHTHPSHITDSWEQYRGRTSYDFGGIISQVWRAWGEALP